MKEPTLTDYAYLIITLFEQFEQTKPVVLKHQNLCTYKYREMIILFMIMQFRRITEFQAQHRWLQSHPEIMILLRFNRVPHRTTLSRQYKKLGLIVTEFATFVGQRVSDLDKVFGNNHLIEDKSLFKAAGSVWHQSDRQKGHIPEKLRRLDTEATWSKSAYQGWVYGYGLHLTCTEDAFPKMVCVETATIADSTILDHKAEFILTQLQPETLTADDGYTKAMRIRNWLKEGTILITPALRWIKGRYAQAYHQFLQQPDVKTHLKKRKTSVEPLFDLIAKVMGANGYQKQLSVQNLVNIRTSLVLGTLSVQISMIMNSILGLPLRNISLMKAAFS